MIRDTFEIEVDSKLFTVELLSRPFREGREVIVAGDGLKFSLSELGLGKEALKERIISEISKIRSSLQKQNSV